MTASKNAFATFFFLIAATFLLFLQDVRTIVNCKVVGADGKESIEVSVYWL